MSDADRADISTSAAEFYDSPFVPALFGRFAEAVVNAYQLGPK
jgi:hypothetical protein